MVQPFSTIRDARPFPRETITSARWLVSLPVRLEAWLGLSECDSGFGPLVFLQTSLLLSSLRARLTFSERPDGRGRCSTTDVPLVSAAHRVTPPRQMVRASHPHPEIQLMVRDEAGEALTDHASLGACLNGWREIDAVFPLDTEIAIELLKRPDPAHLGAAVQVRGELLFARGCSLRLEFHSSDCTPATGMDVPIAPTGRSVSLPERTARAEWDGPSRPAEPYWAVGLVDESGLIVGEERFLGRRCPVA